MAEQIPEAHPKNPNGDEAKEHGCFHFLTKKEDKTEDVAVADLNVNTKEEKEKQYTLMDELQRTHSHSTSSSDEEVDEGGERKKKKKMKMKKKKGLEEGEDGINPVEKCCEEKKGFLDKVQSTPAAAPTPTHNKEKKGIVLDKIKEKLPGHHSHHQNEVDN